MKPIDKVIPSYVAYAINYNYIDWRMRYILGRERYAAEKEDDDCLIITVGRNNSGKTTLTHHLHFLYTEGQAFVENIAQDKEELRIVMKRSLNKPLIKDRVIHYDEANVSRRDALTRFNKDLIDLYFAIRGKRGLHLWCNITAENLDRPFIEERVRMLIYCFKNELGTYIALARDDILNLLDAHKNLKSITLERYGKDYATIKNGRFLDLPDKNFKEEYLKTKIERLNEKLRHFHGKKNEKAEEILQQEVLIPKAEEKKEKTSEQIEQERTKKQEEENLFRAFLLKNKEKYH